MKTVGNDPTGVNTTEGLSATPGSMPYIVAEIERHFHNRERWFGAAAAAVGETHVADRMAGGIDPFTLTAGNDDFGAWVQLLGSEDTPIVTGAAYFDAHNVLVTGTNSTDPFIVQLVSGESSGIAAKLAVNQYTEVPYISGSNLNDSGITHIKSPRIEAGEKIWARACCIGGNGSTISVYFGIHGYEG